MGTCTRYSGTSSLPTPFIKVKYLRKYIHGSAFNKSKLSLIRVSVVCADFVQCLQCYYQSGCLYRLRALGERHNMDLTVGEIRWQRSWSRDTFVLCIIIIKSFIGELMTSPWACGAPNAAFCSETKK